MDSVEDFILEYPYQNTRELMQLMHQLLLDSIPHICYDIKWKVPYYTYNRGFCFMNPKPDRLILGLMNGAEMTDPHGLLEGGQKLVRHYISRKAEDIYKPEFLELLMEAVVINESK